MALPLAPARACGPTTGIPVAQDATRSRNPSEVIVGEVGRSRESLGARGRPRVLRQHFQRELPQRRVSKGRHATLRTHASVDESLDIDVDLDFHLGHRSRHNATPQTPVTSCVGVGIVEGMSPQLAQSTKTIGHRRWRSARATRNVIVQGDGPRVERR
jgi:hypothetical protein